MLKRVFCILFCLLLCLQVTAAPEVGTVENVIQDFMTEHGLDESNFSVSFFNEKSGESYSFNDKMYVPMGKLWTLPLNMYFYEEEILGNFDPMKLDPENPQEFLINGKTLEECRYRSIIQGDENTSYDMMACIGTIMQYLQVVNERYGRVNTEGAPVEFWNGQAYSVEFFMNCIRQISAQPERFGELMANYRMAQKEEAFADGSVPYMVVQIHGAQGGFVTAAAEVSAYESFLLVATVAESAGGDAVLSALNKTLCDYVEESVTQRETEATEATQEATQATEATETTRNPNYYVGEDRVQNNSDLGRWMIIAFAVAAVVTLALGIFQLIRHNKRRR